MSFDAHSNFLATTVAVAPSPAGSGTSLSVASGTGGFFPTPPFNVTIYPSNALPSLTNAEVIRVNAISGDDFTDITREQEDSTARDIVVGDRLVLTITAKVIKDIEDAITAGGAAQCPDDSNFYRWVPRIIDPATTPTGEWQLIT